MFEDIPNTIEYEVKEGTRIKIPYKDGQAEITLTKEQIQKIEAINGAVFQEVRKHTPPKMFILSDIGYTIYYELDGVKKDGSTSPEETFNNALNILYENEVKQ